MTGQTLRDQVADLLRQAAHVCLEDCTCDGEWPVLATASTRDVPELVEGAPDALADAVLPVLRRDLFTRAMVEIDAMYWQWREHAAKALDDYAGNYPRDVFPEDSTSRDGIAGTAMRHAYRNAAGMLRDLDPPGHIHNGGES